MKRKKQFCAVWMEKKHEWSLEEKKVCKDKYKKKRKNNCEISLKDKQNLCRPVVTCLNLS